MLKQDCKLLRDGGSLDNCMVAQRGEPKVGFSPVSMQFKGEAVAVFQNLMHLSAVPPPDAMSPCWWGDQARALTAA